MSLIDERFLKIVEAVEGMEKCVSCAIWYDVVFHSLVYHT